MRAAKTARAAKQRRVRQHMRDRCRPPKAEVRAVLLLIDGYKRVAGGALRHRFAPGETVDFWETRGTSEGRFAGRFASAAEAEGHLVMQS